MSKGVRVRVSPGAPDVASMVELVDTTDLKSVVLGRAGSTPATRTKFWRVGRVVEGSGLLSRPPSNRSIGSNPILSANFIKGTIMARTNSSFKLSKTAKRMMAATKFKDNEGRGHFKRMMIEAEHAASIPVRLPKTKREEIKE